MSEPFVVNNFIDGGFCPTDEYMDSFNPATGQVWARVANSSVKDVHCAVEAATRAFKSWSATSVEERSAMLLKIADLIESRLDEFAQMESKDQGKPVWLATKIDIPRVCHNFRFFATYILHDMDSARQKTAVNASQFTVRCPVGVAGLIIPWNLPLYLLSFKIAPALACGNTCVVKPSEMTSASTTLLCQVFQDAGLPKGVVNIVNGEGRRCGQALVEHENVPLISFTGSTPTAEHIRRSAAHLCKKFSLELGGKNAAVIFDDCDFDKCLDTTIRSSFINQGEVCLCTSRIYVQRKIYDKFLTAFVEKAKSLVVGDPEKSDTFTGAVISKQHMEKITGYIELSRKSGCSILCGHGVKPLELPEKCKNGYFVRPTVIANISDDAPAMKEEIFGPVTCVVPFDDENEVVDRVNSAKYGLCASVWTENASRIQRMCPKLEVGTVWVNCWLIRDLNMPFGGMKDSGIGREGGKYSSEFYTEEKCICIQY